LFFSVISSVISMVPAIAASEPWPMSIPART
jgi:hypothetical protein